MTITHDALGHRQPPPNTRHGTLPPCPLDARHRPPLPATDMWLSSLETCCNLFTWTTYTTMVLTSSGGHRNMYGWQVGSTHPDGMLSCSSHIDKVITIYCRPCYTELLTNR